MYNLIFVYFYYLSSKRNPNPRFVGLTFVALTTLFHFVFLLGIMRYLFGIILPRFDERYFINKIYLIPFVVLWLFAFELFYNKKRAKKIIDLFEEQYSIINFKNTLVILIIMFAPLLAGIFLFNNA